MKLVSIILPVYKSEAFISETLESILNQTYKNFEIIIIDDGSPDNSAAVCASFDDRRIRLFSRENAGACRSRNYGIEQARGDYIAFIDHDDHWLPEKLEKHIAHLERSPEVGLSYGPSEFMDSEGRRLGLYQMPKLLNINALDVLCRNPIGNGSVPVIRRELMESIKFTVEKDGEAETMYFDAECMGWEDVELWFRMIFTTTWKFEGIADCLTLYRLVPDGISGIADRKHADMERGIERARRYADEFITKHRPAALAYHLRYLSRRMIQNYDRKRSLHFVLRAIRVYPLLLVEDPGKTWVTLVAASIQRLLPTRSFQRLESFGRSVVGRFQVSRLRP